MTHRLHFFTLITIAPLLGSATVEGAVNYLRTVALSGQPAPGASGAVFGAFTEAPTLNELGQVAFVNILERAASVGEFNDHGAWSEGSGSLALVAREDDPAPGLPEVQFGSAISLPMLNDSGQTAFRMGLRGPGTTSDDDGAIWSELNGPLQVVVREGSLAPGIRGGGTFSFLFGPSLGESHLAFTARLLNVGSVSDSNDTGLWRADGGAVSLVAREGTRRRAFRRGCSMPRLTKSRRWLLREARRFFARRSSALLTGRVFFATQEGRRPC
jgi:hypothetical protein